MDPHVRTGGERLAAPVAAVRPYPQVDLLVPAEGRRPPERLVADVALVPLRLRVHLHMLAHRARPAKRPLALGTRVRPLAGVQVRVKPQQRRRYELLAADGADIRLLARVNRANVAHHAVRLEERRVAQLAGVRLHRTVGERVRPECGPRLEQQSTYGTHERPFAGVRRQVISQFVQERVSPVADGTLVALAAFP